jgi:hypothetical protein
LVLPPELEVEFLLQVIECLEVRFVLLQPLRDSTLGDGLVGVQSFILVDAECAHQPLDPAFLVDWMSGVLVVDVLCGVVIGVHSGHSERGVGDMRVRSRRRKLRDEPFVLHVLHDVGDFRSVVFIVIEYPSKSSQESRREFSKVFRYFRRLSFLTERERERKSFSWNV